MQRTLMLALLVLAANSSIAQPISQKVAGKIWDEYRTPLVGATVILTSDHEKFSTASSEDGGFVIDGVPPGRYRLRVFFVGYVSHEEEIIVNSDRAFSATVELVESSTMLSNLIVRYDSLPKETNGVRTISIEKTMRVPANFFDPARMLTSYPGVVAANDQSNAIIVKGYSPNALLWRLQGLDIVNPNHLANAGTLSDRPVANGGGVNVLSAQVLDKTDFYSGTLPIQYGNALSGAMNMTLRPGDKAKSQFTAQASLIGLDFAGETPIVKGKSSILMNYRYSTIGLLSNLGLDFGDEAINFQDYSFHYDHDQKKNSHLSVFGFGGLSSNRFDRKPAGEWEEEKDRYNIDFEGKVFGIGFAEQIALSKQTLLKLGSAFSGQTQNRESQSEWIANPHVGSENFQGENMLVSNSFAVHHRANSRLAFEGGAMVNYIDQTQRLDKLQNTFSGFFVEKAEVALKGWLAQPYVNAAWKLSNTLHVTGGIKYVTFSGSQSSNWEPRVQLDYKGKVGNVSLHYGITSQFQPIQLYQSTSRQPDRIRSQQASLNFQRYINRQWSVTSSIYVHQQSNVGINRTFGVSAINVIEEQYDGLWQFTGKGENYGTEFTLERKFSSGIYMLAGGSIYKATYTLDDPRKLPSRFDGRFTSSLLGGKEWNLKKNILGVHLRMLYLGGMRERTIDMAASSRMGTTEFDLSSGYHKQLPSYFRTDLRISWRKSSTRYTRVVSLDVQNATAYQNLAFRYFDTFTQSVRSKYQLSLIPILVYRIDF